MSIGITIDIIKMFEMIKDTINRNDKDSIDAIKATLSALHLTDRVEHNKNGTICFLEEDGSKIKDGQQYCNVCFVRDSLITPVHEILSGQSCHCSVCDKSFSNHTSSGFRVGRIRRG